MSEAYEVSSDDAAGVAEGIQRAARGATVHVVSDGQPLVDIVPPASDAAGVLADRADVGLVAADDSELRPDAQSELEAHMTGRPSACADASDTHATRFGAPTLWHYRAIYAQAGAPWPGDAFVRRHYPVADVP